MESANNPELPESIVKREETGVITLRFDGENPDGTPLHELKADHVSDVLEGLSELVNDLEKAGAFHDKGPDALELYVRPVKQGSFVIEVVEVLDTYAGHATTWGLPSVGGAIWAATRIFRDQLTDFEYLDNGNVKINWRDGSVNEVSVPVWEELNKRTRKRKKQLRKIMRPLEDPRVTVLEATDRENSGDQEQFSLTKADYVSVKPSEEIEESYDIFEITGSLSAIDFDDPDRWKVNTNIAKRVATVEDEDFLEEVANGLPLSSGQEYLLRIREDKVTKNGRTTKKWTILKIQEEDDDDVSRRTNIYDESNDDQESSSSND